MSPLVNELRQSLHRRADTIAAPPDIFADVERRARRIRQNRTRYAVGGAALAVIAVAITVPNVLPRTHNGPAPLSTSSAASATPTSGATYDLDPSAPWAYRGDRAALADLATWQHDWTSRHPAAGTLRPLFGQIYEPSGQPEVVFVAGSGANARWGAVSRTTAGTEFVIDRPLPVGTRTLAAALPGDEIPRLLIVAAPAVTEIRYAPDGSIYRSMAKLADGVAITPLDGDASRDRFETFGAGGESVDKNSAPDASAVAPTATATPTPSGPIPANVLSWPTRGTVPIATLENAETAYAASRQQPVTSIKTKVLYAQPSNAVFPSDIVLAQMWVTGDPTADTVGFVGGTQELQLKTGHTSSTGVIAMFVSGAPGSLEQIVVVPRPTFGQALYAADGSHYVPVASNQDGVVVISRDPTASNDKLRLLDGDGVTFFDDAVLTLLCGVSSCG